MLESFNRGDVLQQNKMVRPNQENSGRITYMNFYTVTRLQGAFDIIRLFKANYEMFYCKVHPGVMYMYIQILFIL